MPLNETKSSATELTFEKLVYGGEALARTEAGVVLVPFAAPGDRALVELRQAKGGLRRGRIVELLNPAAERVQPPCPYFTLCGGCHYQHLPYPSQLNQKEQILREVFRRVGKLDAPETIDIVLGPEWGYRNRIQLHMADGQLGYLEAGSHTLQQGARYPGGYLRRHYLRWDLCRRAKDCSRGGERSEHSLHAS